ncbi:FecR family protein [Agrobacterium burrii]
MLNEGSDALRRMATSFIVRLRSGAATVEDTEALRHWRSLSADHERAFIEASTLWRDLGPALEAQAQSRVKATSRRSFLVGGSLAAGLAGIAVALPELGYLPSIGAMLANFSTGVGEQQNVSLPDGSTAFLDGGSALSLERGERQFDLTAGAAVFTVQQAANIPFVVKAGNGRVQTAGGTFSVTHNASGVTVECLSGPLSVHCLGDAQLLPGEAIVYSDAGLGEKSAIDLETASAWREGMLVFNNRPLEDIVASLNRHRRGRIIITRQSLRSLHVSGVFQLNRPQDIIAHLEETLHLHAVGAGGILLLV